MVKTANNNSATAGKQGDLITLDITDLSHTGDGIGKLDGKVVFVPNTVTGDRALVRLIKVKKQYAYGKVKELLIASPYRIRPHCIVADKCGGCQWQHIKPEYQILAKQIQVRETLRRIGGFAEIPVAKTLATSHTLNYRNKSTYPLRLSANQQVQAGYYVQGTHQLINLNQCPVQDARLNPLLAQIKQDINARNWSIYQEKSHTGKLRHLSLRIGIHTGEQLLTLVSTDQHLPGLKAQAAAWLEDFPQLVGVCLNHNPAKTNVIFGNKTTLIAGKSYLREIFAGLEFRLQADTFFQINTSAAELLLKEIINRLEIQGNEFLLDAYCGIGTFTLPLSKLVKQALGIEVHQKSVEQAKINAQINQIENVSFISGKVEQIIGKLTSKPDIVILDPPRQGCDSKVMQALAQLQPDKIVYVSCKPATLARDLKSLCSLAEYELDFVQPIDFFPQTPHVETAAFLSLKYK